MTKIFFLIALFLSSTIALGAGEPEVQLKATIAGEAPQAEVGPVLKEASAPAEFITKTEPDYTSMDFLSKLMSILVSIYMTMWTLGEILTRISVWTENKWDNKLAERVSQVTWFIGAFCGRMGWKLPKLVIEHEAEKIATLKAASASDKPSV